MPGLSTEALKALVRTVPDFPKSGIQFRDITTLLAHGEGLAASIDLLADRAVTLGASKVAGIEARGFIFGTALALRLGLGFVPLRKAGKLPVEVISEDYALEYGSATLELDPTIIEPGEHVLVVDDLLATGGTAIAGANLLRRAGARVEHAMFVIDLPELAGAQALRDAGVTPHALMEFAGH
ncbi:MAG: adenine phosphoribosyltransferase [Erythrobacter sp.]|nr:adenine phosphoribosyltransferase [Erythrobacter sp.]